MSVTEGKELDPAPGSTAPGKALGLMGYADRLSVQPGENIRFMISSDQPQYQADIVRLIHGDRNPKGPGFKEELVETPANGTYTGREQPLNCGSYVRIPDSPPLHLRGSFTLQAWIYPTRVQKGMQGIIAKWSSSSETGYGLFISDQAHLALAVGSEGKPQRIVSGKPLQDRQWYFAAATYDAVTGRAVLYQKPLPSWPRGTTAVVAEHSTTPGPLGENSLPLLIAAHWQSDALAKNDVGGHFNGKIDSPRLFNRALDRHEIEALEGGTPPQEFGDGLIAAWDFSEGISSKQIHDSSPNHLHGTTVNMPMRAATGHNWRGRESNFNYAREEYGAIHFHDDDLDDAGWEVDFEFHVPRDMKSGVYAVRLRAEDRETYVTFFVRPVKGKPTAQIAYLMPTFNYMAYANLHSGIEGLLSLYDHHSDGSGVCYASRLRPLLDFNPKHFTFTNRWGAVYPRHLCGDLYATDWMEAKGFAYDILTDEDLHREGTSLLASYRVILTGSHPEYYSEQMLDAFESYLQNGGRLMYLGGNGFYWVTSITPELPHLIEIRRWGGTETWLAAPGEYHHSNTGELGGLWRHRGRVPQQLVGVGFTAQGWHEELPQCAPSRPYRRNQDSFDRRASFIFEGIGPDELIGDYDSLGLGRGAAGDELDRFDHLLGTPFHALCVATATGFDEDYLHVVEEIQIAQRIKTPDPLVRSDIVYFEYPNGGAVFSVGSISWFGSLSHEGYQNNVSRITENVLRRFVSDAPLGLES
jgi:N,N-dimethylformamidase